MCLCVSEDKERMETAGGPELHGPSLVPALHRLLRRHGEHHLIDRFTHQLFCVYNQVSGNQPAPLMSQLLVFWGDSDVGGDRILFVLTEADFMSGDITGSLDQPWHRNKRADIIVYFFQFGCR